MKITYESHGGKPESIQLGRFAERETGDICLSRHPHCGVPIKIMCLIRSNGDIVRWIADWDHKQSNPYWHFDAMSEEYANGRKAIGDTTKATEGHPPTAEQREAIARLFFGACPFGLRGSVGAPVQEWCKFEGTEELERLGNQGQRAFYT